MTADVEWVARNEARGKSTHLAFAANIHSHHTLIPEAHIRSDQLINSHPTKKKGEKGKKRGVREQVPATNDTTHTDLKHGNRSVQR